MSVNVHCCEGINVQKLLCRCICPGSKAQREQVLYTDSDRQIIILSTQHSECTDLVVFEDLEKTDVLIVSLDKEDYVRFVSVQGRSLFDTIDGDSKGGEHKQHPSISSPADIIGRRMVDILPEWMLKFLTPICKQTLHGSFLQMTILWRGFAQLVRTHPLLDHKNRIIGGVIVISPFASIFNPDVNRFCVGSVSVSSGAPSTAGPCGASGSSTRVAADAVPEHQTMDVTAAPLHDRNHSGLLKRL